MKNYKLVGEDEHLFHIQHPDGSSFAIAKAHVGPEVHKQIKALEPVKMADGGEVPDFDETSSSAPSDEQAIEAASTANPMAERENLLKHYQGIGAGLAGGPESRADNDFADLQRLRAADPGSLSNSESGRLRDLETWAGGAPQPSAAPANAPNAAAPPQRIPQSVPGDGAAPAAPPMPGGAALDPANAQMAALNQQMAGQQGIQGAIAQQGKESAEVWKKNEQDRAAAVAHFNERMAPLEQRDKDLFSALSTGKIDPARLWHNMGTGNKVLAALSVALSGIGAGLQGHGAKNMALDVIDKEIDRDIQAQRDNMSKTQTLYSDNLRRMGDERAALAMTKSDLLTSAQAQLAGIAAKSQSAQAAAMAQVIGGQFQEKKAMLGREIAFRQMGMQGGNYDPATLVPYLVPPAQQKEVFGEIKQAQNAKQAEGELMNAFDAASKENTLVKTGGGYLRTPASILKMRAMMLPIIHDAEGRVNEFEQKTTSDLEPKPGDTDAKIAAKRQALTAFLQQKKAAPTAKGFNIDLNKFGSTTSEQPPEVKEMGGVKYQKVPGGWKKI